MDTYLLSSRNPSVSNSIYSLFKNNKLLKKITIFLLESSSLGLFTHVTRYTLVNGVLEDETDLSPGGYWVHKINTVNSKKRVVFVASPPGEPGQRKMYEVDLCAHKDSSTSPRCVSCGYKSPEGSELTFN